MKLLDKFINRDGEGTAEKEKKAVDIKELEIYSGMRVMVETQKGQMLFIANLLDPHSGTAKLCQCSDNKVILDEETVHVTEHMHVRLRGYNNHKRKAVLMEGVITPEDTHLWQIKELTVTKVENERTFYRLNTDIDAIITAAEDGTVEERQCKLLNISVGGTSIRSEYRYHKGDRFLLKVKLLENESEVVLYCEVLRVTEMGKSMFEYGCRFLELAKAGQEQIARTISAIGHTERENCFLAE